MKYIVTIFVLSTCSALALPDFRLSNWGDTMDQVLEIEPEPLIVPEDIPNALLGETVLEGVNVWILYHFVGDKLTSANYLLKDSYQDQEIFWSIYFKLEPLLASKYGAALRYHGFAAAIAIWETPLTRVGLFYDFGNSAYPISLGYSSKEFNYLSDPLYELEEF